MSKAKEWDNAFTGTDLRGTGEHAPASGGALSVMRRHWGIMYELGEFRRRAGVQPLWLFGLVRVLMGSR